MGHRDETLPQCGAKLDPGSAYRHIGVPRIYSWQVESSPGSPPAWFASYEGLPLSETVALAKAEGHPVRVLRPGALASADSRPNRLNILVDADDQIVAIHAG